MSRRVLVRAKAKLRETAIPHMAMLERTGTNA